MTPTTPANWSDYRAAVTRFTDAIDAVLEQGRASERRHDAFLAQHGIEPGIGEARLTAESLPPDQRHIHRRLLELMERAYASLLGAPKRTADVAATPAAARLLRSHHRI